jgi:hypothetical protein
MKNGLKTLIPQGRTASVAFSLLSLPILVVSGVLSAGFGQSFRAIALSHDPTLAAAPWETLWGLVSYPVEALLPSGFLSQSSVSDGAGFLFLLVILYAFVMRKVRSGISEIALFLWIVAFAISVGAVSIVLGVKDLCAGPEILVFALLLFPYVLTSPPEDPNEPKYRGPMNRTALFLGSLAAGLGVLYLFLLAPAIRRSASTLPVKTWKRYLAPLLFPSLAYFVQRLRYPNPDLPLLENIWSELANAWLYGKTILDDSFGGPDDSILFRFPGIGLGVAWLLSWGFVRLCAWVRRTSAGRTVPAQLILFLLPILYLMGLLGASRFGGKKEIEENPLSSMERLNYARALHETLPSNTTLYAPRVLYDLCVYLRSCEGVRNRVELEPGGKPFWSAGSIEAESLRPTYSRTPVAYSEGRNWVGVAGEPVDFAPQHLLDATEVYMATPTYYIGGDPFPELTFDGKPFLPKTHPAPDLNDWGVDGEHFYLFRDRVDPIWRPLGNGWEVHYFGFLLADNVKVWNRPIPLPAAIEIEDFYK